MLKYLRQQFTILRGGGEGRGGMYRQAYSFYEQRYLDNSMCADKQIDRQLKVDEDI